MPKDKEQKKRPRDRPKKLIAPIPGPYENIIKALVTPVEKSAAK